MTIIIGEQQGEIPYTFGNIIGFDDDKKVILHVNCDDKFAELSFDIKELIDDTNILTMFKERIEELIKKKGIL